MEKKINPLCANLSELIKKTLICFCELNVIFQDKLEIYGSVHVKADGQDVLSFLLNEHCRQPSARPALDVQNIVTSATPRLDVGVVLPRRTENNSEESEPQQTPQKEIKQRHERYEPMYSDHGSHSIQDEPLNMQFKEEPMDGEYEYFDDTSGSGSIISQPGSDPVASDSVPCASNESAIKCRNSLSPATSVTSLPIDLPDGSAQAASSSSQYPAPSLQSTNQIASGPVFPGMISPHRISPGSHQHNNSDPEKTCPMCLKAFSTKVLLRMHMEKMHKEQKPVLSNVVRRRIENVTGALTCPACPSSFKTKLSLDHHIRAEHQHVRYPCEKCNSSFKSTDGLRCHMNVHHSAIKKVYPCPWCTRVFYTRQACYSHKLKDHYGQSRAKTSLLPS